MRAGDLAGDDSTVVPGFGDLRDPEVMLSYKIQLAEDYRDALEARQNHPDCSDAEEDEIAARKLEVIGNLNLLRAQLTALQSTTVTLVPPTAEQIDAVRTAVRKVEALVRDDAVLAGAIGLLGEVLSATGELMQS